MTNRNFVRALVVATSVFTLAILVSTAPVSALSIVALLAWIVVPLTIAARIREARDL